MINKLIDVLRSPFVPLYSAFTEPALEVSAAILDTLLNHLIVDCINDRDDGQALIRQVGWERVANAVLAGVIVSSLSASKDSAQGSGEGLSRRGRFR